VSRRVDRPGIDGLAAELRDVAGGELPDGREKPFGVSDPLLRDGAHTRYSAAADLSTARGSACAANSASRARRPRAVSALR
jgi:hypothetical protein